MTIRMTFCLPAVTALALSAMAAQAGGPVVVIPDPVPTPPPVPVAYDWTGFYGGLSYGRTSASADFSNGGSYDFEDGSAPGAFIGYQMQRGSLVYGGELAYAKISDASIPGGFGDDDELTHALDLKARVGFAANRALFYGVLGYSMAKYSETPTGDWDLSGMAYGLGAEFAVSQRFSVGLEYLNRKLDGDGPTAGDPSLDVDLSTIALRGTFRF